VVSAKLPSLLCAEKGLLSDALQAAAGGYWQLEALLAPKTLTLWGEEV